MQNSILWTYYNKVYTKLGVKEEKYLIEHSNTILLNSLQRKSILSKALVQLQEYVQIDYIVRLKKENENTKKERSRDRGVLFILSNLKLKNLKSKIRYYRRNPKKCSNYSSPKQNFNKQFCFSQEIRDQLSINFISVPKL